MNKKQQITEMLANKAGLYYNPKNRRITCYAYVDPMILSMLHGVEIQDKYIMAMEYYIDVRFKMRLGGVYAETINLDKEDGILQWSWQLPQGTASLPREHLCSPIFPTPFKLVS